MPKKKITFKYDPPEGDRRHFVDEEDVRVVIDRLPSEVLKRLKGVYFKDRARGRRIAGYVTRGRKDIVLCAFPPRVSFSSYLRRSQNPPMFGVIRGAQWPTLAVRRYMLYDVFLHELGHLQKINRKSRTPRRKYAGETKAQDFGEYWCRKLWSQQFDHPDPVHNPPSKDELEKVYGSWGEAHAEYKKGLLREEKGERELAVLHYSKAVELYDSHALALEALGIFNYDSVHASSRATGFLEKALRLDPTLHDANLFIGLAYADQKMEAEARLRFERAMKLTTRPAGTLSVYATSLAEWGKFDEAKPMFRRAYKKAPTCPFVHYLYKRFLLHENNPEREENLRKKAALFSEKDFSIIGDQISIYSRGLRVYSTWSRG